MLSERKQSFGDMRLYLQLSVHDSTSIRYEIVVFQIEDYPHLAHHYRFASLSEIQGVNINIILSRNHSGTPR